MDDPDTSLHHTIETLRAENQQLIERFKHQVRIEQTLLATQNEADEQRRTYQRLYELGQQFSTTRDIPTILAQTIQFVLYDLNVERCLILLTDEHCTAFRVAAQEGYYDEETAQGVAALVLPFDDPLIGSLSAQKNYLLCTAAQRSVSLDALGQRIGMDEYAIFRLPGGETHPTGLLIVGNTATNARYQTRVQDDEHLLLLNLANLVNQVATTLTNANLYASLQNERSHLERKVEERTAELQAVQAALVRELSTPLIPLAHNVVLMPLIGSIDSHRAQQVMETLLDGITAHQADTALLDLTGVSVMDTPIANALIQAAQAARLLGTQVILTGIGPAMAQTLVHLGTDLRSIQTRGNLQSAITEVLRQHG